MGIRVELLRALTKSENSIKAIEGMDTLEISTDSRQKVENSLFIPIVGEYFDGHDHLFEAKENGAVAALWQEGKPVPRDLEQDFPLFFVEDTLVGLQTLATMHRHDVAPIVIGITGSNGKTTTKEIVASLLSSTYKVHKTKGNLNNHIGVPLTLLAMPADCEVCVLEMGMNHFGEISLLSQIAEPDVSIITNIGESHIEFLGSRAGIAKAKLEILEGMKQEGTLIIDGDEPLLTQAEAIGKNRITCGYGSSNDYVISSLQTKSEGSVFTVNGKSYNMPLLGAHNVKNTTYAIALAYKLHLTEPVIEDKLKRLESTSMRLETLSGKLGTLLINDAYNASPTSMKAAVDTVKQLSGFKKRVIVLGDMYELGDDEEALHREVAEVITEPITQVITIGEKAQWIADECRRIEQSTLEVISFSKKEEALPLLFDQLGRDTVMLFKASRLAGLETLIDALKDGGDES
ncbi:UDP-N-acetylmuramoyl-tripeptide--D-alanyl-D-alanine ligase [Pullulanibacillus pueri]|uniref:UDP-N-acetylmuramoyl-tripeptide--D-alanyl-D-alanine ligase n=1 Tax=Pullulanibacillus pueri TaxID=1437324 RepID=A0A8J2ZRD8_9BACL|nr:UDP-N-acetylmuramoyl-tripeptide--D-alanyl-D-alanine ligase [Pullulanibacillus pueri]MBM7680131.1 UDP-N-acetylmuramoyl-tripeptide--D-alanyl-D-alanine ligase [Pullulanibacillus pueri]GGH74502.1 UDP-N-acetylmuramoyl-tripeptide--D-alanyl-D-alanine ligase [Pullulanibacillus pueri]